MEMTTFLILAAVAAGSFGVIALFSYLGRKERDEQQRREAFRQAQAAQEFHLRYPRRWATPNRRQTVSGGYVEQTPTARRDDTDYMTPALVGMMIANSGNSHAAGHSSAPTGGGGSFDGGGASSSYSSPSSSSCDSGSSSSSSSSDSGSSSCSTD